MESGSNVTVVGHSNTETSSSHGGQALTKADGKKRVIDEDEDATATEGENSITNTPSKKTKETDQIVCLFGLV